MQTVFIAGATGYLGRHLVKEYAQRGWHARALVRNAESATASGLGAHDYVTAEATQPDTLKGCMEGADLVISALGITRQKDGLTYRAVDYQANLNLLREAERAKVKRFAYVHVLGARQMMGVPLVQAKQAFVDQLECSPIPSTIIAPSGYFSDMAEILNSAKARRAWVFGYGSKRLNPIHGADLATAAADAIERGEAWLDVGGPDTFTQAELAQLAFEVLGTPAKICHVPDWIRKAAIAVLPHVTPIHVHGPAQFFLTALGIDMVGEAYGKHRLGDHFCTLSTGIGESTARAEPSGAAA
ncbi:SDR family oxidoreductase [Ahrensia marina]|uniref:SDR family oxidoreductase n=1 Tax=Ahrensia marina TaxID=1514904 RepID=UPI0035D10C78